MMKKKLALLATPLMMFSLADSAIAGIDCMDLCLTPYVGADAQIRHMGFKKDFGGNALKKNYPQGNFFAGLKFNPYVGIEFGYEASKKKSRKVKHNNSDIVFGAPLEQVEPGDLSVDNTSHSSSKTDGWNANLVGFFPIICEDNSLQLIGSIGMAQLKIKSKNSLDKVLVTTTFDPITDEPTGTEALAEINNRAFTKRKAVLRISSGIQNMITDCIGIRALVMWENTTKLKAHGKLISSGEETTQRITKPKNSFNYGLGIFTYF